MGLVTMVSLCDSFEHRSSSIPDRNRLRDGGFTLFMVLGVQCTESKCETHVAVGICGRGELFPLWLTWESGRHFGIPLFYVFHPGSRSSGRCQLHASLSLLLLLILSAWKCASAPEVASHAIMWTRKINRGTVQSRPNCCRPTTWLWQNYFSHQA